MAYIEITNNSEKYIKMLKQKDKIYIKVKDIKPSISLVKMLDPLFSYYDVESFIINGKEIKTNEIFPKYKVICGHFYCGEGFIQKLKY